MRQEENQRMIGVPTRNGLFRHPIRSARICFGNVRLAYLMRAANGMANVDALDALAGGGRCENVRVMKPQSASLLLQQPGGRKALRNVF